MPWRKCRDLNAEAGSFCVNIAFKQKMLLIAIPRKTEYNALMIYPEDGMIFELNFHSKSPYFDQNAKKS